MLVDVLSADVQTAEAVAVPLLEEGAVVLGDVAQTLLLQVAVPVDAEVEYRGRCQRRLDRP